MEEVDVFDKHQATLKAVSAQRCLCESDDRLTATATVAENSVKNARCHEQHEGGSRAAPC